MTARISEAVMENLLPDHYRVRTLVCGSVFLG
jgi:hypothetical protein